MSNVLIDNLKYLRQSGGLSATDAARAAGVEPETYKSWESGTAVPTAEGLGKLSSFYGLPGPKELLTETYSNKKNLPTPQDSVLAGNLTHMRHNFGLTPAVVAENAGVDENVYSGWEGGTALPSSANLKKLSAFYGIDDPKSLLFENYAERYTAPEDNNRAAAPKNKKARIKVDVHAQNPLWDEIAKDPRLLNEIIDVDIPDDEINNRSSRQSVEEFDMTQFDIPDYTNEKEDPPPAKPQPEKYADAPVAAPAAPATPAPAYNLQQDAQAAGQPYAPYPVNTAYAGNNVYYTQSMPPVYSYVPVQNNMAAAPQPVFAQQQPVQQPMQQPVPTAESTASAGPVEATGPEPAEQPAESAKFVESPAGEAAIAAEPAAKTKPKKEPKPPKEPKAPKPPKEPKAPKPPKEPKAPKAAKAAKEPKTPKEKNKKSPKMMLFDVYRASENSIVGSSLFCVMLFASLCLPFVTDGTATPMAFMLYGTDVISSIIVYALAAVLIAFVVYNIFTYRKLKRERNLISKAYAHKTIGAYMAFGLIIEILSGVIIILNFYNLAIGMMVFIVSVVFEAAMCISTIILMRPAYVGEKVKQTQQYKTYAVKNKTANVMLLIFSIIYLIVGLVFIVLSVFAVLGAVFSFDVTALTGLAGIIGTVAVVFGAFASYIAGLLPLILLVCLALAAFLYLQISNFCLFHKMHRIKKGEQMPAEDFGGIRRFNAANLTVGIVAFLAFMTVMLFVIFTSGNTLLAGYINWLYIGIGVLGVLLLFKLFIYVWFRNSFKPDKEQIKTDCFYNQVTLDENSRITGFVPAKKSDEDAEAAPAQDAAVGTYNLDEPVKLSKKPKDYVPGSTMPYMESTTFSGDNADGKQNAMKVLYGSNNPPDDDGGNETE